MQDERCRFYFLFPFSLQVWQIRWRLLQQTWWSETGSLFSASEAVLFCDFDIFVSESRSLKPPDDAGQRQETRRKHWFSLNPLNMIKKHFDHQQIVNRNSQKYGVVSIFCPSSRTQNLSGFHVSVFSGTTESEIWTINTFKADEWLNYLTTQLLTPRNNQISQSEHVNNTRQAWLHFLEAPFATLLWNCEYVERNKLGII